MRTIWFLQAGFFLLLAQPVCGLTIGEVVAQINRQNFQQTHANLFISAGQNRGFTGDLDANILRVPAFQHDAARDYIRTRFEEFGLHTSLDPFWFTKTYGAPAYTYTNCNNVVAIQYGAATNAGWYIIGGHYDSVDEGQQEQQSPGADDNASGTAGVLEVARVLSRYTFRDNLMYIAFDAEEKTLQGSWHFVDTCTTTNPVLTNLIQRSAVRGMISLDMIAYNPTNSNHNEARIRGGSSSTAAPVRIGLSDALRNYTSVRPYNSGVVTASDHQPFYSRGMDACLLIEYSYGSNPFYHKTGDSINSDGYIDYDYAVELTRGVAAYCCEQAGIILPATLTLPDVRADRGETVFSWGAPSGSIYRIEYTGNLRDTNGWHPLCFITNFSGWTTLSITDQVGTVSQRFYRVEHLYEQ